MVSVKKVCLLNAEEHAEQWMLHRRYIRGKELQIFEGSYPSGAPICPPHPTSRADMGKYYNTQEQWSHSDEACFEESVLCFSCEYGI